MPKWFMPHEDSSAPSAKDTALSPGNLDYLFILPHWAPAPEPTQTPEELVLRQESGPSRVAIGLGERLSRAGRGLKQKAGMVRNLLPGEEFPIKLLVSRAPKYASVSYQFAPKAMTYGSPQRFDLAVESAKLAPTSLGGYNLTGRLRNKDKADVQHVRVVALLFGADQKIVGMQDGILSQQTLPAGDECPFSVNVFSVAATPKTFRVYTSAMAAR